MIRAFSAKEWTSTGIATCSACRHKKAQAKTETKAFSGLLSIKKGGFKKMELSYSSTVQKDDFNPMAGQEKNPIEAILMLYDGSIQFLERAVKFSEMGNISDRDFYIGKAKQIIAGLQNTIDFEAGGEVAENLSTFYLLIDRMLSNSVGTNDMNGLQQVIQMLSGVKEAWQYVSESLPEKNERKETIN
jgi:flagellar protein FliS